LSRIPRWLADSVRLVALTGVPGSGKTRLSLHVAQEVQRLAGWPALFLSLAAIDSPELIVGMIAVALSLGEDSGSAIVRVRRRLNEIGPALLVLDNLEHLDGVDHIIADLVEGGPELRVLTTSRRPLDVPGVRRFDVQPLPVVGDGASRQELRENPAVQLFASLAGRAHFVVTDEDLPEVGQICASLDGLPLAIELAAARTATLGLDALAQLSRDRRELLNLIDDALDPRHRSLRTAISWSYGLLPDEVQIALNRLAVFTGGFSQVSAERMLGTPTIRYESRSDLLDPHYYQEEAEQLDRSVLMRPLEISPDAALRHLLDANLISASAGAGGDTRYQMLASIREFGLERLERSNEEAEVRFAHAIITLAFEIAAGYELWTDRSRSRYWPQVGEEQGNVRAALAWACDPANEQPTLAALLALSAWFSFQVSGLVSEGRAWLERATTLAGGSERVRLHAMNSLAFAAWTQGDSDRASQVAEFVISAWQPGYQASTLGIAHFNAGLVAWQRGDFQTMAQQLMTAKPILHEGQDLNGEGFCDLALGVLARFSGDFAAAQGLLDEALALHTQSGHEWGAATSRYLAGETAHDQGTLPDAAELLADGLERYFNQGDVYGSGACVAALAVMAAERNELERAARLFGAAFGMGEHAGVVLPPVDLERYQQTAAMVAAQVPESEFRTGRSWSFEQATQEALALAAEIAAGRVPGPIDDPLQSMLTVDQRDAVNLLCQGLSVDEIASQLFRDPNTIYDRLARARQRLGVTSNHQLMAKVSELRGSNGASPAH
jgi:non-specific serine/threonine protein kinase